MKGSGAMRMTRFPVDVGVGTWRNSYTFRDEVGVWLTLKGASEKVFRISRESLEDWANRFPCRFLKDGHGDVRSITFQRVPPPGLRNRETVLVFLKADLQIISDGLNPKLTEKVYRDGEGVWLTDLQLRERYQVSRIVTQYWRDQPSRLRPGAALRSKPIPSPKRMGPATVPGYLEEDIIRILREEESDYLGVGNRGQRQDAWKVSDDEALGFLRRLLAKGPVMRQEVVAEAKAARIHHCRLWRAKKALRVKSHKAKLGPWYWCLPGQTVPAVAPRVESNPISHMAIAHLSVERIVARQVHAEELTAEESPADQPGTVTPDDQATKWSEPDSPTEWARKFGVSYNTMMDWLRSQKVKNQQVSARRYRIALEELPGSEV